MLQEFDTSEGTRPKEVTRHIALGVVTGRACSGMPLA